MHQKPQNIVFLRSKLTFLFFRNVLVNSAEWSLYLRWSVKNDWIRHSTNQGFLYMGTRRQKPAADAYDSVAHWWWWRTRRTCWYPRNVHTLTFAYEKHFQISCAIQTQWNYFHNSLAKRCQHIITLICITEIGRVNWLTGNGVHRRWINHTVSHCCTVATSKKSFFSENSYIYPFRNEFNSLPSVYPCCSVHLRCVCIAFAHKWK